MGTAFLQLGCLLLYTLPGRAVLDVAPPPTDVAPPPVAFLGLGLGALAVLAGLCGLVVVVAVVAFFVIRAVRKNRMAKETAPLAPKENS